jgi:endonuclease VIII
VPEGHTIHRLARDHAGWFAGREVRVSSPQGRFTAAAAQLDSHTLVATDAFGKHLFHRYDDGRSVHIHLGLFGKVFHHALEAGATAPQPRDTVRYRVEAAGSDGGHAIDLVGATACELLDEAEVDAIVARLGPDPIREDADPDRAWAALQRRSVGIGRALMDQSVLAGVGNVYRAEVLFVHGLHPDVPARDVDRATWDAMWATLVEWLRRGVKERRIITVDPKEIGVPRSRMRRADATYAYHQDHCRRCGTAIRRYDLAGRWAYACETCQPPPRAARARAAGTGAAPRRTAPRSTAATATTARRRGASHA